MTDAAFNTTSLVTPNSAQSIHSILEGGLSLGGSKGVTTDQISKTQGDQERFSNCFMENPLANFSPRVNGNQATHTKMFQPGVAMMALAAALLMVQSGLYVAEASGQQRANQIELFMQQVYEYAQDDKSAIEDQAWGAMAMGCASLLAGTVSFGVLGFMGYKGSRADESRSKTLTNEINDLTARSKPTFQIEETGENLLSDLEGPVAGKRSAPTRQQEPVEVELDTFAEGESTTSKNRQVGERSNEEINQELKAKKAEQNALTNKMSGHWQRTNMTSQALNSVVNGAGQLAKSGTDVKQAKDRSAADEVGGLKQATQELIQGLDSLLSAVFQLINSSQEMAQQASMQVLQGVNSVQAA